MDAKPNQTTEQTQTPSNGLDDVPEALKPFYMCHEGVKKMHSSLLGKVGLGKVNKFAWDIVDQMRDTTIEMFTRRGSK